MRKALDCSVTRACVNGHSVYSEVVQITPEMAAAWLERNTRNRRVVIARVKFYAAQMKAGEWKFTHQGIAFDELGDLVDGQHRLWAVIESGVSVKMMVTRGMKRENMIAIDGGRPRSTRDAMILLGHECSARSIATARLMLGAYAYGRMPGSRFDCAYMVSNEKLMFFHDAIKEALDFATPVTTSDKGLSHACVAAAIGCAWFSQNREVLSEFKEQFASGVIKSDADIAAVRLRTFMLTSTRTRGGREARADLFVRACTAIRAYLSRKPITKLYAVYDAIFSIPDVEGFSLTNEEA